MNQLPYQQGQFSGQFAPAPQFALKIYRHPQRTEAAKAVNRLSFVSLMQTAASFVFVLPVMILCAFLGVSLTSDPIAYQLLNAAAVPLSTTLPYLIYLAVVKLRRKDSTPYLCFSHVNVPTAILVVLTGWMLCLMANFPAVLIQDFFSNFGYNPGDSASLMPDATSWTLLLIELFSTAILVPVMEELAFRGVLLSALKRFGAPFAIVMSSLIFALAHLDFSNVVFAFIAGLVFGIIYYYTENLWLSVVIHALNNGCAVLGSALPELVGADETLMQVLFMDIPVVAGLVAALVLLIYFRRRLTLPGKDFRVQVPLTVGDGFAAAVRAPLLWVLIAMSVAYTVTCFF